MSFFGRLKTIIGAKANNALGSVENPHETLDYSYEKQLQLLQNVKRGIVEVVTSKRRLELQASKLQDEMNKRDQQARQAMSQGREDLARTALERKQALKGQLEALDTQIAELEKEQTKLTQAESRLAAKVESFRTRKETIKAQYSAAEAQVKISEAVTGLSEEMGDIGLAVDRAEQKTETMRARAGALDELLESGTLDDFTTTGRGSDSLDRELSKVSTEASVESELAALRSEMGGQQSQQAKGGA